MKTSKLGYYPNIGKQKGSCADYNANNTWYFNSTNGCVNNNNRYNGNFRSRPVLDYFQYDNELLENYPLPLSQMYLIIRWYLERTIRKASENPNYAHYYKEKIRDSVNSYLGLLRHISGYKLRRKVCRAIPASPLSEVFAVTPDFTKITIVPKHSTDAYYRQQYHQLKIQLP